ncbi:glycosyltransferase [Vibrio nereis]|uniref:glycosyltransferase n=1 Tax=Vibrio nereis TaxID=693 RepID=UPI0024946AE0|nr:glycosyltransferase [Vibrio nereis]
MKKLLYVSDSFRSLSVFESQVHTLCNKHAEKYDVTLLALCKPSEMTLPILPDAKYKLEKFKKLPKFFSMLSQKLALLSFKQTSLFEQADIIHCRGHIGTLFALLVCKKYGINKPIVSDIRGVSPEEFLGLESPLAHLYSILSEHVEKYLFKNIKQFFFVTKNMEEHYLKKYPQYSFSSEIYPTIVNDDLFFRDTEKRHITRHKLGYSENHCVYCYVGNTSHWQKLDKILLDFNIKSNKNNNLRLLIVTTEPNTVNDMLSRMQIDNPYIVVTSSSYQDVPNYLNASDYGLLIRDNTIVNHVASPTKRNEYSACGLPTITDLKNIGDLQYEGKCSDYKPLESIVRDQSTCYERLTAQ